MSLFDLAHRIGQGQATPFDAQRPKETSAISSETQDPWDDVTQKEILLPREDSTQYTACSGPENSIPKSSPKINRIWK